MCIGVITKHNRKLVQTFFFIGYLGLFCSCNELVGVFFLEEGGSLFEVVPKEELSLNVFNLCDKIHVVHWPMSHVSCRGQSNNS